MIMGNSLTQEQGQLLLELARKTLETRLQKRPAALPPPPDDPAFSKQAATFVTLKIAGKLRGCIGNVEATETLWAGIRDNAVNAALHDHRFSPLTPEELSVVQLDISILSPAQPLHYERPEELPAKLRAGVDGVILRDGSRRATFLPQVWQQLPEPDQFLDHLCLKAGLAQETWRRRKLDIFTYQVQCFAEEKK